MSRIRVNWYTWTVSFLCIYAEKYEIGSEMNCLCYTSDDEVSLIKNINTTKKSICYIHLYR